jgi:hypothetical protein
MVEKLKTAPKSWIVGLLAAIGFGIFISINILVFRTISTPEYGIIAYEFAWSVEKVNTIFAAWGPSGILAQRIAILWDFPYIIGYSLLIAGCILLVARLNEGNMQTIGLYFTLIPFIAGILDAIENTFLLIMIDYSSNIVSAYPIIAAIAAGLKFGLLIIGILYFLVGLIWGIIGKLKKK